jgi:hypothetical protein
MDVWAQSLENGPEVSAVGSLGRFATARPPWPTTSSCAKFVVVHVLVEPEGVERRKLRLVVPSDLPPPGPHRRAHGSLRPERRARGERDDKALDSGQRLHNRVVGLNLIESLRQDDDEHVDRAE